MYVNSCLRKNWTGLASRCQIWAKNETKSRPVGVISMAVVGFTRAASWKRQVSSFESKDTASLACHSPTDRSLYELSLQLSQRPMNGNASMHYTRYAILGTKARYGWMTKLEIATRYGLSTRDLRIFDRPSGAYPYILIREHTILFHLFDLRGLVQHDHARVFQRTPTSHANVTHIDDDRRVSRVFSLNIERRLHYEHEKNKPVNYPYELRILETALASVTSVLEAEYLLAKEQVSQVLQMTGSDTLDGEENLIHSKLRAILDLKQKLLSIGKRALQTRIMTQEILNDDEDMANIHLTEKWLGKPFRVQDHQDVEYLFETYFKASEAVEQDTSSLMNHIRRTEDTIQFTLNVRRNQIMVLEARLEILMLAFAGATLIAGWYGMNLVNYFEESAHGFAVVTMTSVAAVVVCSWYGMRRLRWIRNVRLRM